jgi:hypothetical protein
MFTNEINQTTKFEHINFLLQCNNNKYKHKNSHVQTNINQSHPTLTNQPASPTPSACQ